HAANAHRIEFASKVGQPQLAEAAQRSLQLDSQQDIGESASQGVTLVGYRFQSREGHIEQSQQMRMVLPLCLQVEQGDGKTAGMGKVVERIVSALAPHLQNEVSPPHLRLAKATTDSGGCIRRINWNGLCFEQCIDSGFGELRERDVAHLWLAA